MVVEKRGQAFKELLNMVFSIVLIMVFSILYIVLVVPLTSIYYLVATDGATTTTFELTEREVKTFPDFLRMLRSFYIGTTFAIANLSFDND